jgi:hypothetical protein
MPQLQLHHKFHPAVPFFSAMLQASSLQTCAPDKVNPHVDLPDSKYDAVQCAPWHRGMTNHHHIE